MAAKRRPDGTPDKLTIRQQRFVEEYLIDFNTAGASRRSGYVLHNPWSTALRGTSVLANEEIRRRIAAALQEKRMRAKMNADWVPSNLKQIVVRYMDHQAWDRAAGASGL